MALITGFKQKEVEVQESMFKEFTDGWYDMTITSADVTHSDHDGLDQVVIDFTAGSGDMQGKTKKVWLSINSANEVVARIANSQLVQIAEACGIEELADTDELVGKDLGLKLYTNKKGYQNMGEVKPSGSKSNAYERMGAPAIKQATTPPPAFDDDIPDFAR